MSLEDEWITSAELHSRLAAAGEFVSPDQLERRRGWGLIPAVRQAGLGRGRGSQTLHPGRSVQQGMAAARLFGRFRDRERVGWELWRRGYEVDERYWRPLIVERGSFLRRAFASLRRMFARANRDEDFADRLYEKTLPRRVLPTPIRGSTRNQSDDDVSEGLLVFARAATGDPEDALPDVCGDSDAPSLSSSLKLLGLWSSERDVMLGMRLDARAGLASALPAMVEASPPPTARQLLSGAGLARLHSARDDVHNAFCAAAAMHEAWAWIYGPRAFGLKLIVWFASKAPSAAIMEIILLWMQLRDSPEGDFFSSSEIAELRRSAEEMLALSAHLRAIAESSESLRDSLTPRRLRKAFSSEAELQLLVKEIEEIRAN